MKRFALVLFALAVAACKKNSTGSDPVGSVLVSPAVTAVGVGDTTRLNATVRSTSNQVITRSVEWRSLNTSIATVDGTGLVRGVAAGTAMIEAKTGGKSDTASVTVASGALRTFNVNADVACSSPVNKSARLVAQTARVAIYEDLTNPTGGPTAAQYQDVANTVESLVYDINVANFGAPTDIDGNGKIIVLYTRAVNELTPAGAGYVVGGFQYARDLFPKVASGGLAACPASNAAEMFYMLSADPTGSINGNSRSVSYVLGGTVGIVAHEFQHLINAGRRLYIVHAGGDDWDETVWLNEGLSHIAEELSFYGASGRAPRSNLNLVDLTGNATTLAAFNAYGIANLDRFDEYLNSVTSYGPFQDADDLEVRGASWSLLRYVADRKAGTDATLWQGLVNNTLKGIPNLDAAVGGDATLWARDWAVANYTDDAGIAVSSLYTHPSWNFRNIMAHARWGGYGIQVNAMSDAVPVNATIRSGSAAYFRFGVAPAGAGDIRVALGGTAVAGACTPVALTPGQVFHGTPGTASAVCLAGGATGGEYVLVTHFASRDGAGGETADGNAAVTVVGAGITAPVAPPSPVRLGNLGGARFSREVASGDGGFETRLRRRERDQLRGMVGGASTPAAEVSADPAVAGISINIVRIR